jgi:hypothetical protein
LATSCPWPTRHWSVESSRERLTIEFNSMSRETASNGDSPDTVSSQAAGQPCAREQPPLHAVGAPARNDAHRTEALALAQPTSRTDELRRRTDAIS